MVNGSVTISQNKNRKTKQTVLLKEPKKKTNGAAKRTWDADLRFAICSGIRDTSAKDM